LRATKDEGPTTNTSFVFGRSSLVYTAMDFWGAGRDCKEGLIIMSEIVTGTVKWFNAEKGYGFIATADRGDVFVHVRALAEGRTTLAAGESVYFTTRQTEKGAEAANVRVGTPPPPPKPATPTVELPTPALPGYASMRVVGRPAAVQRLGRPGQAPSLVAFTVEIGAEPSSALPKSLPPPSAATTCLVLISIKHWQRVASALDADHEDTLVIDGYAGLDPLAPGMITLRATSVTTTAFLNARRAAQAARDKHTGPPDAQAESPRMDGGDGGGAGDEESGIASALE
jgi:CspA family cold shock protein